MNSKIQNKNIFSAVILSAVMVVAGLCSFMPIYAADDIAITIQPSENGKVTGPSSVAPGADATFKTVPDENYHCSMIIVNDGDETIDSGDLSSYTHKNTTKALSIGAVFSKNDHEIEIIQTDGGKIEGSKYAEDKESILYKFTPDKGYKLDSVVLDGNNVDFYDDNTYLLEDITKDHILAAGFVEEDAGTGETGGYTVKCVVGSGSGKISGPEKIIPGENATYKITPSSGYVVDDVFVDGKTIGPVEDYTFEEVDKDHTLTVNFAKKNTVDPTPTPSDPVDGGGNNNKGNSGSTITGGGQNASIQGTTANGSSSAPKTGDGSMLPIAITALVGAGVIAVIVAKKKK